MKKVAYWFLVGLCFCFSVKAQTYETGVISVKQPDRTTWFRVDLNNTYAQPIVITGPLTEYGGDPAGVRLRNITSTSFEYQIEEFDSSPSASHAEETFSYLVIEQGVYNVGGNIWEAGITNGNTDGAFLSVPLSGSFSSVPIIFAQLASEQDPAAATLRIRNVTTSDFEVRVDEEENTSDPTRSASDAIHFLAVQVSSGTIGSGANASPYLAQTSASTIDHTSLPLSFSPAFSQPVLLASTQTTNGGDPFFLRYSELNGNGVNLRIAEETSNDSETDHDNPETVSYLVLEGGPADKRLLWVEEFGQADGTTADNGLTAWTIDDTNLGAGTNTFFGVRSGELAAQETVGEVVWVSESIPITGYNDVKIAVDIRSEGGLNPDDSIQVYYRLDGGTETPLLNGLQIELFDATTAMIGGLSGNQLEVIVRIINSGGSEIYYVDNVRVYTEIDDRYAIQNGDWDDPATWSYTPSGASCSCIPDLLSSTHINGYTVDLTTDGSTRHLTVYSGSQLQWAANSVDLMLFGNATLDVQNGGQIDNGTFTDANLFFNQWTLRHNDADTDRIGEAYPRVNVTIDVDDPNGLIVREFSLNSQGTFTIQGSGNIVVAEDLDVDFASTVTNNLTGNLSIAQYLELSYPGVIFTNNGNINVTSELQYERNNHQLINEGTLSVNEIEVITSNSLDHQLTNRGTLTVKGETDFNGSNEFRIENYGTITTTGSIVQAQGGDDIQLHNYENATWHFGDEVDTDIKLHANYEGNTINYNGIINQTILDPQDAYWNLTLSNRNTSGSTESLKTPEATSVDINGNLTIVGTAAGEASFRVSDANADVTIAGDWWQDESGPYAQFSEGNQTVTFDGVDDQEIITSETFHNFTINKPGGKVTATDGANVENEANLVGGIVEVPTGSRILFENSASVGTVSNASHVQGGVTKQGATDFTFPVGDGTHYRPLGISSLSAASNLTVDYYNTVPPDASLRPDSMVNLGSCGYWEVSSSVPSATAQVTLYWDADCPVDFSEVAIARWNGTIWEEVPATRSGNGTAGSITTDAATNEFGLFTLAEVSDTPVANDDAVTTPEDTPLSFGVVTNDTDANGLEASTVTIVDNTTNGTITLDTTTGNITYTPAENFNGNDSLVYTVQDVKGIVSNQAVVRITVQSVNDAPVAEDDEVITNFRTILSGSSVLTNDDDPVEGDTLVASLVAGPNNGALNFQPDGTYIYVPDTSFVGIDTFTYQACDSGSPSACDTAQVTITVLPFNFPPQAQDDFFQTNEDTEVTGNLLLNDQDPNGDSLVVVVTPVQVPAHGTVELNENGTFAYTPEINFYGTDELHYQVCDNGDPALCDTAHLTIEVLPINDVPVAADDTFSATERTSIEGNVLDNDYDPDNQPLGSISVITNPSTGKLTVNPDGNFMYTPEDYSKEEYYFTYQVCDGSDSRLCDTAQVTLQIPVNRSPLAVDDVFGVTEGNLASGNVLHNDEDPDGDDLSVTSILTDPSAGIATVNPDGSFEYVPNEFFTGEDQFTYQACDNQDPNLCAEATVRITIAASEVLQIPKGFSPNGDGVNDGWAIEGIRAYPNNRVKIFNRWGNVVYEESGYDNITTVWRGEAAQGLRVGGDQLPSGTYFYVINLGNNQKPVSGYIVLKR